MTHDPEHPDLAEDFAVDADNTSDTEADFVLPALDSLPELAQTVLDTMLDVAMDPTVPEPEGDLVPETGDADYADNADYSDYSDFSDFDKFSADESSADDLPLEVDDADDAVLFDDSSGLI